MVDEEAIKRERSVRRVETELTRLRESREQVLATIREYLPSHLSEREPITRILNTSRVVNQLVAGELNFAHAKAELERILPGQPHNYTDTNGLFQFLQGIAREERQTMQNLQEQIRNRRLEERYSYYLNEVNIEGMESLMADWQSVGQNLDRSDIERYWEARRQNLPACVQGMAKIATSVAPTH